MQPRNSRPRSCRQLSPACRTSSKNSTWWGKRCAAWSTAKQLGSNDVHQTGSEECASPINSLITLPSLNIYTVRIIYIYLLLHPPPHYITYCPNSIYIYIIIYIHIYRLLSGQLVQLRGRRQQTQPADADADRQMGSGQTGVADAPQTGRRPFFVVLALLLRQLSS